MSQYSLNRKVHYYEVCQVMKFMNISYLKRRIMTSKFLSKFRNFLIKYTRQNYLFSSELLKISTWQYNSFVKNLLWIYFYWWNLLLCYSFLLSSQVLRVVNAPFLCITREGKTNLDEFYKDDFYISSGWICLNVKDYL